MESVIWQSGVVLPMSRGGRIRIVGYGSGTCGFCHHRGLMVLIQKYEFPYDDEAKMRCSSCLQRLVIPKRIKSTPSLNRDPETMGRLSVATSGNITMLESVSVVEPPIPSLWERVCEVIRKYVR